jgi:hypothetical protein
MNFRFYNFKLIKVVSILSLVLWLILGIWFLFDSQRASIFGSKVLRVAIGDHSVRSASELLNIVKRGVLYKVSEEEIPKLFLDIKYKDLLNLENQRIELNEKEYVRAILSVKEKGKNKKSYKIKVRLKGDRKMHKLNSSEMSMKVDIRGKKLLFGMEEFSLQKPIVRNYTWETLLHLVMKDEGVLALKQVPVRFFRNGVDLGVFFIEEGFGKELIESQKRKIGPIVGIDESFGVVFPNVSYDFYSERKLIKNTPGVYEHAKEKLSELKKNFNKNDYKISDNFNVDLWAKFFAISDLFGSYHGTVPKSVKLYYNPSNILFEPILFDGHVGAGRFDNFILSDFLNGKTLGCEWICENKDWYMTFFKDPEFLEKYYFWLERYSSEPFVDNIMSIVKSKIEPINDAIYSELGLSDNISNKGMLPFYFNKNRLKIRSILIRKKLEEVAGLATLINGSLYIGKTKCNLYDQKKSVLIYSVNGVYSETCKEISDKNKQNNDIGIYHYAYDNSKTIDFSQCIIGCQINKNGDIDIDPGLWFIEDLNLEDTNVKLSHNSTLVMTGNTEIIGNKRQINFEGQGSIVQLGGSIILKNIRFNDLTSPSVKGVNWSGSVNIIDSNAVLNNVVISNNKSEDSINFVNSNTKIEKIKIINALSDGIDVDFGVINFNSIYCEIIGNDCLDTSGSTVQGEFLQGTKVGDKVISFGEGSIGKIKEVSVNDVDIVAVSKDSSLLSIGKLKARNYKVLASSFTKKSFFGAASLSIDSCNQCLEANPVILNGAGNTINIESIDVPDTLTSKEVESLMYGGSYGRATIR